MAATHRSCARFRDDLSGFADHTLPPRRWEQVGYHVAGCDSCRNEVAEIKRVCSTLSAGSRSTAAPNDLALRLQRIAGEHADAPLYLSGGDACPLPTRADVRRRRMVRGGIVATVAVVSVVFLALLLAPEPLRVTDPVREAREQYSLSVTAVSVNEAVGAVLLAYERGADFGPPVERNARASIVSDPERVSERAAIGILDTALRGDQTHTGIQRVWISDGQGRFHASDVEVDEVAGEGASLVVLDRRGERFMSWFVPSSGCCATTAPVGWTFHRFRGMDQVAGRWASVLEARDAEDYPVARWWVDQTTGLLLWSERYDTFGRPTLISGFTDVDLGHAELNADRAQTVSMDMVHTDQDAAWCEGLAVCRESLAGLPLVARASSGADGRATQRLVYSDGLRSLSVSWTPGVLDADGNTLVLGESRGKPSVAVWQAGEGVVSVATNGGAGLLAQARLELPSESPWEPSVLERLQDGLLRVAGVH